MKDKLPVFKCSSPLTGLCVNIQFFSACQGFLGFWWWTWYKYFDRNIIGSCMKILILSNKYFAKTSVLLTHFRSIVKLVQQWDQQKARQEEEWYRNTVVATDLSKWEVKMHWKLNCWAREKWWVFFVKNCSWDAFHLIFVVTTSAQKYSAAKMW